MNGKSLQRINLSTSPQCLAKLTNITTADETVSRITVGCHPLAKRA